MTSIGTTAAGVRQRTSVLATCLRWSGLVVEVEGCAWRRFVGGLDQLANGRIGRHDENTPTPVRQLFEGIWRRAAAATLTTAPWHGARVVWVLRGGFDGLVSSLALVEHRASDGVFAPLTARQAALARALAGELLDVLACVPSSILVEKWPERLASFGTFIGSADGGAAP